MRSSYCHTNPGRGVALRRLTLLTVIMTIGIWLRRGRTRRQLRDLDARELLDIGVSESQRDRECARWLWQGSDGDLS
jgi:uncharacterized protein YjiS (DUF1127 family)